MKLISYLHGIGDTIMLTPAMRALHEAGERFDLVLFDYVKNSHLLDNCQYINNIHTLKSHWKHPRPGHQYAANINRVIEIGKKYDETIIIDHKGFEKGEHKVDYNMRRCGVYGNTKCEVFIPEKMRVKAKEAIDSWGEEFVFAHWCVPDHPYHTWKDATAWINANFGNRYYLYNTCSGKPNDNINMAFAMMSMASAVVLCSSVFVHAADAMGIPIDCLYYGHRDDKVIPRHTEIRTLIVKEYKCRISTKQS